MLLGAIALTYYVLKDEEDIASSAPLFKFNKLLWKNKISK
jgi:hypothetical protein